MPAPVMYQIGLISSYHLLVYHKTLVELHRLALLHIWLVSRFTPITWPRYRLVIHSATNTRQDLGRLFQPSVREVRVHERGLALDATQACQCLLLFESIPSRPVVGACIAITFELASQARPVDGRYNRGADKSYGPQCNKCSIELVAVRRSDHWNPWRMRRKQACSAAR